MTDQELIKELVLRGVRRIQEQKKASGTVPSIVLWQELNFELMCDARAALLALADEGVIHRGLTLNDVYYYEIRGLKAAAHDNQKKHTDMTKEEKELLVKFLCEQLPYGVQVEIEGYHNGILKGIDGDTVSTDRGINYPLRYVKPYLRPLPSMTEAEARDIAKLYHISDSELLEVKVTVDGIDITLDDNFCSYEKEFIRFDEIVTSVEIFDYINAKHFDIRGLIPKGLAIAAIGENNPYKKKGDEK